MRRLPKPSPALVVATLALFVALGGTGVAAHLAVRSSDIVNNSIRSEDVVDDSRFSLSGKDIREGTLEGLVAGDATVRTKRVELGDDGEAVLVSIPGLGVLRAFCAGGSFTGSNVGFQNTSSAEVDVWLSLASGPAANTGLSRIPPGHSVTGGYFGDPRVTTWHVGRGAGDAARSATIFVADSWDASSTTCRAQATAVVRRG